MAGLLMAGSVHAEPLWPAPEALVNSAPDFRLHQALHLNPLSRPAPDGLVSEPGLHWGEAPVSAQFGGRVPSTILQLSDEVRHVILADLSEHRLYLLENRNGLRVLRHMYATIGKNGTRKQVEDDGRTPIGVYTVTRYIDDANLPELYGAGAFPVSYPNIWDRRASRTGYGIWVHGVPRANFTRPPRSSEGCVAVGNQDFESLKPFVTPGQTRVIFSDTLRWLSPEQQDERLKAFRTSLRAWQESWNALDTEALLGFYAEDFATETMDRRQFAEHKRRVNAHKQFVQVELRDLNVFDYPDDQDLRLVEFTQDYRSDTYADVSKKRQFWRRESDGRWRIALEKES